MTAPTQAVLVALVAAIGWWVNHWLAVQREERRRKLEAQLRFVERQIEELYGPLAALLYEGRRTYRDLLDVFGRDHVFPESGELEDDELQTWLFWAESEFLPHNESIKSLLKTKAHLIVGGEFPESYVDFLDHCNSWGVNHRRWKQQNIAYSWHTSVQTLSEGLAEYHGANPDLKRGAGVLRLP